MTTPRSNHSAILLPDGRVLIVGGNPGSSTAELYDPKTGTFTTTGKMVGGEGAATLLDTGQVLIVGGSKGNELYDPLTGTFEITGDSVPGPPNAYPEDIGLKAAPDILLPSGKVLIAGEPSTEVYDPLTGAFSVAGAMSTWLGIWYIDGRTGTLLKNGKVLLAGGQNEDLGYTNAAELYDPSTGQFTAIGFMTRNRSLHTATLLQDGTVLLAGSEQYGGSISSSELYDPATQKFTRAADLTSARFWHTATLLMDGRVLIAGGYTNSLYSNSAELYVPSVVAYAPVVQDLGFDRLVVGAGSSYWVGVEGLNLTPQMFFDVRFTSPGGSVSAVVLNWQKGLTAWHDITAGIAPGDWTINGVRAHAIEPDHTGSFFPVSATVTVSP